jgi:3-oxoacyl-[acyl-carrier protein] reductase
MNIVISGASKGIGLAIAHRYAQDETTKHSFALCSRNGNELEAAVNSLKKDFPHHSFFSKTCDVADETHVRDFVTFCDAHLGAIDVLVNNAGTGIFKQVVDLNADEFRSVLGTNLRGVFLLTRELLPPMREKKSGTVVTISSLAGKHGFSGGGAYCASKFAVRGFMQCLFLEVRADNIRCITVYPGSVDTDFFIDDTRNPNTTKKLTAADVAESVWAAASLPEGATLSEIDIRPTNPKG